MKIMKKKENNKILFTQEGLDEIKKEYDRLVNTDRQNVLTDLQNARAMGDLSENAMYSAAREKQSFVEGRIREIEDITKRAEVISEKTQSQKTQVDIGSSVTLETQKQEVIFNLVGAEEVNFAQNKISHESPLGKALLGKKVGDMVEVTAPVGIIKYKVIKID